MNDAPRDRSRERDDDHDRWVRFYRGGWSLKFGAVLGIASTPVYCLNPLVGILIDVAAITLILVGYLDMRRSNWGMRDR